MADEGIYHILNRGNDRQRVFHKDGDYRAFLKLLGEMKEQALQADALADAGVT